LSRFVILVIYPRTWIIAFEVYYRLSSRLFYMSRFYRHSCSHVIMTIIRSRILILICRQSKLYRFLTILHLIILVIISYTLSSFLKFSFNRLYPASLPSLVVNWEIMFAVVYSIVSFMLPVYCVINLSSRWMLHPVFFSTRRRLSFLLLDCRLCHRAYEDDHRLTMLDVSSSLQTTIILFTDTISWNSEGPIQ